MKQISGPKIDNYELIGEALRLLVVHFIATTNDVIVHEIADSSGETYAVIVMRAEDLPDLGNRVPR